jgi:glycosyltransferase involved in cell wall biosynthesis
LMIAFVQPYGVQGAGGGSRILRALLAAEHPSVVGINTGLTAGPVGAAIEEIHIPTRPGLGRLDRTRLRPAFGLLDEVFRPRFEHRLGKVLRDKRVKAIHNVPHTYDIVAINRVAYDLGIPYFLTIHDELEYSSPGHLLMPRMVKAMGEAWRHASCVFVISEEIGREYCRRYGAREYRVVTDGLSSVAEGPQERPARSLRVYFMGLFHLSYGPNFRAVLDALRIVRSQHPDWEVSFTSRGGWNSCPVSSDDVAVRVLPFAHDPNVVEQDMLSADLLYQPLPFQPSAAALSRFSMSTKMVTYLGSGLPILYHGPQDAAACKLLTHNQAAIVSVTLDPDTIAEQLIEGISNRDVVVCKALALARSQFILADQQRRFWQPIVAAL